MWFKKIRFDGFYFDNRHLWFFWTVIYFFSATNMVHKNNTKPISLFPDIKRTPKQQHTDKAFGHREKVNRSQLSSFKHFLRSVGHNNTEISSHFFVVFFSKSRSLHKRWPGKTKKLWKKDKRCQTSWTPSFTICDYTINTHRSNSSLVLVYPHRRVDPERKPPFFLVSGHG